MNKFFVQIKADLEKKSPLYIRIKVLPKSPVSEIVDQLEDGTYKIRIKAPAIEGKANAELIRFLKKEGGLQAEIISGQTDRTKLVKTIDINK